MAAQVRVGGEISVKARALQGRPRVCGATVAGAIGAPRSLFRSRRRVPKKNAAQAGGVKRAKRNAEAPDEGGSDRHIEGLGDLFLHWLERFDHRLLRQGAEILDLR